MLTTAEVAARLPNVAGNWAAGMVTPSDGRAEPSLAVPALARAAGRDGAVIIEGSAARTLDIEAGRVAGVVTEAGRVQCAQVVLAGGAWSTGFAANAGISLPQLMVRSTVARTEAAPDVYTENISTPGLSLRRRDDGGYTVATGDIAEQYLAPASFRYFTKFLKLLALSTRDVRLRLGAPKGYPGAFGARRAAGAATRSARSSACGC
jgi:glycine/D-amino acid oxidase-like deaminating enzyme